MKENKDQISIIWSSEDVEGRADDIGVFLDKTEIRLILKRMERMHDASIGINWDTIDAHIEMFDADERDYCEDCNDRFLKTRLTLWKHKPEIKLCDSCFDNRMEEDDNAQI